MGPLDVAFDEYVRTYGGDEVWRLSSVFSVRKKTASGGYSQPVRWEPATLLITTRSVFWWSFVDVERNAGLFKKKIELEPWFEHESLPRHCRVMWTSLIYRGTLGAEANPYCLRCGEDFATRVPELLQEAVDVLRSIGCDFEIDPEVRRADLPIR